jgi:hypothetical protein
MLKIVLLLSLNIPTYLYAQLVAPNILRAGTGMDISDHLLIADANKALAPKEAEHIDGTPYLEDNFQEGNAITTKGIFSKVPMRYNVESDNIEFKQDGVTYILDPSPAIKKITLPVANLVVESYATKSKSAYGFYILLDSGKLTLLKKKKVILRPAQAPKAIETEGRPARYEEQGDDFYYKLNGGPVTEFISVKKMIEVLSDHPEEVKTFVSKEKISKKEGDLVKLAEYYNGL